MISDYRTLSNLITKPLATLAYILLSPIIVLGMIGAPMMYVIGSAFKGKWLSKQEFYEIGEE